MITYYDRNMVDTDRICQLSCNLDDMTPEAIGYAMELLLQAGALDVYTIPIGMKKNRPGTMLCCLCTEQAQEQFAQLLLQHTTTLGVRLCPMERRTLPRTQQVLQTVYGPVRVKTAEGKLPKAEYDDVSRIASAQQLPMQQVLHAIEKQIFADRNKQ